MHSTSPLLWASRWLGHLLPERVAGSDIARLPMRTAAKKGWRAFLLGTKPEILERAVTKLCAEHPPHGSTEWRWRDGRNVALTGRPVWAYKGSGV